jgi:MerR family mercuric resistance operon transcriptional regulator
MDMTIGKFAASGGVGVETIRFYQRKGILKTPKRLEGGRHYSAEDVRRLNSTREALERLVAECSSGQSGPCPILKSFGL